MPIIVFRLDEDSQYLTLVPYVQNPNAPVILLSRSAYH